MDWRQVCEAERGAEQWTDSIKRIEGEIKLKLNNILIKKQRSLKKEIVVLPPSIITI